MSLTTNTGTWTVGGGTLITSGTTTLDFGAGDVEATRVITGQVGIVAGSKVVACIRPEATADHSLDEHVVEPLDVRAGNIVAGVGFTIYGRTPSDGSIDVTKLRGLWSVAWHWF